MSRAASFALLAGLVGAGVLFSRKAFGAATDDSDFTRWDSLIKLSSRRYGVPWRWTKAVMMNESSLGTAASVRRGLASPTDVTGSASSDGKSWGLMQVTLSTAREMRPITTVADLNTPAISIDLGAQYLGKMKNIWGLNAEKVVRSYNGGPGWSKSTAGTKLTLEYWNRFQRNLAEILERQPGPVNEV